MINENEVSIKKFLLLILHLAGEIAIWEAKKIIEKSNTEPSVKFYMI